MRITVTLIAAFLFALAVFADSGCRRSPGGEAVAALVAPHMERIRQHVVPPAKPHARLVVVFRHPSADDLDTGRLSAVAEQVAADTEATLGDRTDMVAQETPPPAIAGAPPQAIRLPSPHVLPLPRPDELLRPPTALHA